MPGLQSESSTPLNPGAGGDSVRDLAVTTAAGAVKQQVVVIGDPALVNALAAIDLAGNLYVRLEAQEELFRSVLRELKRIRFAAEELADQSADDRDIETEEK